jgi:hypothetical protein
MFKVNITHMFLFGVVPCAEVGPALGLVGGSDADGSE